MNEWLEKNWKNEWTVKRLLSVLYFFFFNKMSFNVVLLSTINGNTTLLHMATECNAIKKRRKGHTTPTNDSWSWNNIFVITRYPICVKCDQSIVLTIFTSPIPSPLHTQQRLSFVKWMYNQRYTRIFLSSNRLLKSRKRNRMHMCTLRWHGKHTTVMPKAIACEWW